MSWLDDAPWDILTRFRTPEVRFIPNLGTSPVLIVKGDQSRWGLMICGDPSGPIATIGPSPAIGIGGINNGGMTLGVGQVSGQQAYMPYVWFTTSTYGPLPCVEWFGFSSGVTNASIMVVSCYLQPDGAKSERSNLAQANGSRVTRYPAYLTPTEANGEPSMLAKLWRKLTGRT